MKIQSKFFRNYFKILFAGVTLKYIFFAIIAIILSLYTGFLLDRYGVFNYVGNLKIKLVCQFVSKEECDKLTNKPDKSGLNDYLVEKYFGIPSPDLIATTKSQGIDLTGYNISTIDVNDDRKDEIIIEDQSASWWRTTFVLTLEKELIQSGEGYNPKLTPFCKTCKFSYWNGHVEFKDLDGNGSKEAIVTGGIEKGGESTGEIEYREEIYYFENGDFIKKNSKIVEPEK